MQCNPHHCLEVIACFVDIGGVDDHHCLVVIVCFVDIGGVVDPNKSEDENNFIKNEIYKILMYILGIFVIVSDSTEIGIVWYCP